MLTLEELKARLETFSPVQIEFVAQVVESLSDAPEAEIKAPGTWLTEQPEWIEYFGLALSVHHSATTVPLGLKSFESVFQNACEHIGWRVETPESATHRFLDLAVYPGEEPVRRLSLKSTAARRLSPTFLHISKLTEAAWIQDVRSARDRRQRTQALFREYEEHVTQIVMLRAFREAADDVPHRYQLVEVPTSIFDSLQNASVEAFASDAPAVPCLVDGEEAAVVALDRSDAKITVRRVRLDACTVHAEWRQAGAGRIIE